MSAIEKARALRLTLLAEAESAKVEIARLNARLSVIEHDISEWDTFIKLWDKLEPADAQNQPPNLTKPIESELGATEAAAALFLPEDSIYYGKSLWEAARVILLDADRPMNITEITNSLREGGVKFAAKEPEGSVNWAMAQATAKGIFDKVAPATWTLPHHGAHGTVTKPVSERSARAKEGLALAKDRGVRLGRPEKITDNDRPAILEMVNNGEEIQAIADLFDVHRNAMARRINRWRAAGLFATEREIRNIEAGQEALGA